MSWKPTTWEIPTTCPVCGQSLILSDNLRQLSCVNTGCASNIEGRLNKWMTVMDIQHVGPAVISEMVNLGFKSIRDFYDNIDVLKSIDGFGEKSVEKIKKQLNEKSSVSFAKFIAAFNIDGIGEKIVKKYNVKSIEDIEALTEDSITVNKLKNGVKELKNEMIKMMEVITIIDVENNGNLPLSGQSFCFTGTLSEKRSVLEQLVKNLGGEIKSVGKDLTYLVSGDPDSNSGKAKKARSLGIKIIGEAEFRMIVN